MKLFGPIAENGCKYQGACRELYESLSDEVDSDAINRWNLTLSNATSVLRSECGKSIPKCRIYSSLEQESDEPLETRLKEYVRDNWRIKIPAKPDCI